MKEQYFKCHFSKGKSSRFGSNKSLSNLSNTRLIDYVISKVSKYFTNILVISNDNKLKLSDQKVTIISDCIEGSYHRWSFIGNEICKQI